MVVVVVVVLEGKDLVGIIDHIIKTRVSRTWELRHKSRAVKVVARR